MPSPLLLPWDNSILETLRKASQKASGGDPESKERSEMVSSYEWGDPGIKKDSTQFIHTCCLEVRTLMMVSQLLLDEPVMHDMSL